MTERLSAALAGFLERPQAGQSNWRFSKLESAYQGSRSHLCDWTETIRSTSGIGISWRWLLFRDETQGGTLRSRERT